jgi:hypothetical protein
MKLAFFIFAIFTPRAGKESLEILGIGKFKMLLFKDFQKYHAEILPAPADADSPAPHTFLRELLSENNKLYTACKMQTLMESARFLKVLKKCERARMYYSHNFIVFSVFCRYDKKEMQQD